MRSRTQRLTSLASCDPSAATEYLYLEGRALRVLVGCSCAYEVVALSTRSVPTVSHFCRQYPWVGAVILAGLAMHFYYERQLISAVAAAVARKQEAAIT